jgi:chromosomal replication initiation ATPase DnaA
MNSVALNNVTYYAIPGLKNSTKMPLYRTPETIIEIICNHVGMSVDKVLCKRRFQKLIVPRYAIVFFLHSYTSMNKSEIGRKLGFDHTTVIHALSTFKDRIDTEEAIKTLYNELKQKISLTTIS